MELINISFLFIFIYSYFSSMEEGKEYGFKNHMSEYLFKKYKDM